jgi:hypothetical protein
MKLYKLLIIAAEVVKMFPTSFYKSIQLANPPTISTGYTLLLQLHSPSPLQRSVFREPCLLTHSQCESDPGRDLRLPFSDLDMPSRAQKQRSMGSISQNGTRAPRLCVVPGYQVTRYMVSNLPSRSTSQLAPSSPIMPFVGRHRKASRHSLDSVRNLDTE